MEPRQQTRFFPNDLHHVEGFHRTVETHLPFAGRMLDLGCGSHAEMARYRWDQREVWGVDFQTHSRLHTPEWFRLLTSQGEIPFPDDHFHVVSSVMVLEHVERPLQHLKEICRVLRPGGVFIGHTVSARHYVTWLRRCFGFLPHVFSQSVVKRLYGREMEDTFPAHYRLNTEKDLRSHAHRAGLLLESIRRYACPCYFRFHHVTQSLASMLDWTLERFGPGYGRLYLTVTLRKPSPVLQKVA